MATKCIKCEVLEKRNGYFIHREVDRNYDEFTDEFYGRTTVFYTVNTEEWLIDSFKTLREARKYADNN